MGLARGQRRNLYVSRSIQGMVMARFAAYWIGYHFALWHGMLLYGYVKGNLLQTMNSGMRMSFWEYYVKFFEVNNSILVCAALICPIFLWDTLRVTHRIAGPVIRFKNVLKRLTRGEQVSEVKLRDDDLLRDLEQAFNEYLASREKSEQAGPSQSSPSDQNGVDQIPDHISEGSEAESFATSV